MVILLIHMLILSLSLSALQMAEKGERCSSKVWDYFCKDSSNAVFCNIYAANVSQGSIKAKQKNTSNLWTHLKTKHSEQYKEAQQQSEVQKTLSAAYPATSI